MLKTRLLHPEILAALGEELGLAGVLGPAFAALLLGHGQVILWIAVTVAGCLAGSALILSLRPRLTAAEDGRVARTPV